MRQPDPTAPWEAVAPSGLAPLMGGFPARWWVAGGWAVDLALGRPTRRHADIDIAVARPDHHLLRGYRGAWEFFVAHDGRLERWDGTPLRPPRHQFWVRRPDAARWTFEVLLEEIDGREWRYRRDPAISLPLPGFERVTGDGIRYVAPAVTLLYKSTAPGVERNHADAAALSPALEPGQRAWLRARLAEHDPAHPWLALIREQPGS